MSLAIFNRRDNRCLVAPWALSSYKLFIDRVAAGGALFVLSPILILLAIAVRCFLGSPVMFRQMRIGLGGEAFELLKFRSMSNPVDSAGATLSDAERLTRFGRWLRAWSLDELPSLLNVLRGDLSLVGPRPLLAEYLTLYTSEQARRHWVRPGLTGWAQVNGRNHLGWVQRFKLDVWYVENATLILDAQIVLKTLAVVMSRRGITEQGVETMTPFRGEGA